MLKPVTRSSAVAVEQIQCGHGQVCRMQYSGLMNERTKGTDPSSWANKTKRVPHLTLIRIEVPWSPNPTSSLTTHEIRFTTETNSSFGPKARAVHYCFFEDRSSATYDPIVALFGVASSDSLAMQIAHLLTSQVNIEDVSPAALLRGPFFASFLF